MNEEKDKARQIIGNVNNYAEDSGELSISAFGPLSQRIAEALTTARREAREEAFKDVGQIIDAAGEEWGRQARDRRSKTYSAYVIAALDLKGRIDEAAKKGETGCKIVKQN